MSKIRVLVFPAGEINSVELHDALSTCVNIELFGASSVERHGSYIFKNYIANAPLISEPDFFDKFNKILNGNKIDVIFPTHDTVAEFFAQNSEKLNSVVVCSDKKTAEICRDKKATFEIFKNEDFCPKIYSTVEELPVFIKPRKGQGSVGVKLLKTESDIPTNMNTNEYVISEYLPGEEYTVDCITDKNGVLKAVLPRSRKRLLAGVCVAGQNGALTQEIKNIADKINDKLKFRGLWFFQIKKDSKGKFKLLEISVRCAGSMCLSRAMGVNLPLLSIYTAMGQEIEVFKNPYNLKMDRTLISRYKMDYEYSKVYFDFDDTLIIDNKVHLPAIAFLYQCKNKNKKIVLLTKHEYDLDKTLSNFSICKELFDEIIILQSHEEKSTRIKPENAIFIDNSFKERKKVHEIFKIPVFDVDGIEVLADWKW